MNAAARPAGPKDFIGPAASAVLGLVILGFSFQIKDAGSGLYGPRFWPQAIGALMLAINGWVLLRTWMGRPEPREERLEEAVTAIDLRAVGVRHWITAALMLGFPLIVYAMGFLLGSAAFLVAFMVGLGYRRIPVVVITAVVFSVSLTWFFTAGVFTPLPPGKGPFYVVSSEFARLVSGKR